MKKLFFATGAVLALLFSFVAFAQDVPETVTVTSSVFEHHGMVPLANSAYGGQHVDRPVLVGLCRKARCNWR